MYFKEKEDTNIDNDFKKKLSIKDLFNKFKLPIIIILGIILILVIVIILINKKPINNISYFLELEGDTNITLYKGSEYIEAGYTAYDSKGNNLDNEVIVTNNLDTSNIGTYTITYLLHDISKERNINVVEKPIGATYIHLLGNSIIYLKVNETYKEPGYLVTDTVDSNLKDKVKITSNINSKEPGIYKVTYTVTNSSGVTTSASRKVIVMSSDTSLSLDNSEPTNKEVGINIHVVDNYFDYLLLPNKEKITSKDYTYKVSENGTYKFTIYNKKGSHNEETIKITNIDKIKPSGSCTGYMENGKSYITVTATDDMGISKYLVDNVTSTTNTITINKELPKASVTIYDKAGNTNTTECTLKQNTSTNPQIISVTTNDVVVTVTSTKSVNKITGYYFSTIDKKPDINGYDWIETDTTTFKTAKYPGTYYVFVKDSSGYISSSKKVTVPEVFNVTLNQKDMKSMPSSFEKLYKNGTINMSIDDFNKYIANYNVKHTLKTRESVVVGAMAFIGKVQDWGYKLPYGYSENGQAVGGSNAGIDHGRWGVYSSWGKDRFLCCNPWVVWAFRNAGLNIYGNRNDIIDSLTVDTYTTSKGETIKYKKVKPNGYSSVNLYNYFAGMLGGKNTIGDNIIPRTKGRSGDVLQSYSSSGHEMLIIDKYDDNNDGVSEGYIVLQSSSKGLNYEKVPYGSTIVYDMSNVYNNTAGFSKYLDTWKEYHISESNYPSYLKALIN